MEVYAEALQVQGLLTLSVLDDRHDASHIRVVLKLGLGRPVLAKTDRIGVLSHLPSFGSKLVLSGKLEPNNGAKCHI